MAFILSHHAGGNLLRPPEEPGTWSWGSDSVCPRGPSCSEAGLGLREAAPTFPPSGLGFQRGSPALCFSVETTWSVLRRWTRTAFPWCLCPPSVLFSEDKPSDGGFPIKPWPALAQKQHFIDSKQGNYFQSLLSEQRWL